MKLLKVGNFSRIRQLLRVLCFCVILAASNDASSQYYVKDPFTQVIPPSPEASEIGKYGEHPVNYFSGLPQIEIPLIQLKTGNIEFPISLSYHASGVKVDQIASRVGMGWSLSAVKAVTRSVIGTPDEIEIYDTDCKGHYCDVIGYNYLPSDFDSDYLVCETCQLVLYDNHPDRYFFNLPGSSGDFYLDKNSNPYFINKSNIQIDAPTSESDQFKLTDDKGVIYTFGKVEGSVSSNCSVSVDFEYTSSWYLSEIYDPIHNRQINLEYKSLSDGVDIFQSKNAFFRLGLDINCYGLSSSSTCVTEVYTTNAKILSKITVDNGKGGYVIFGSNESREDLTNDLAYTYIKYYDLNDQLIKEYSFNYEYEYSGDDEKYKRLFLKSIEEIAGSNSLKHKFVYNNPELLPSRESNEVDVWGYYNGNGSTSAQDYATLYYETGIGFLPFTSIESPTSPIYEDFDRSMDSDKMLYGILEKIVYPTGGYSIFNYESHEFGSTSLTYKGGGPRIKEIIDYSGDGIKAMSRQFSYSKGQISQYPRVASGTKTDINTLYNKSQSGLGSGSDIFYSLVTEQKIDESENTIGKTEYGFINPGNYIASRTRVSGCSIWPFFYDVSRNSLLPIPDYVNYYQEGESDPIKTIDYSYTEIEHESLKVYHGSINGKSSDVQDPGFGLLWKYTGTNTIKSGAFLLTSKTETENTDTGSITTVQSFDYHDDYPDGISNLLLKSESKDNSNGISLSKEYRYPFDFETSASGGVMGQLVNLHAVGTPVEELLWSINDQNNRVLIGGQLMDYDEFDDIIQPSIVYQYESRDPIEEASFSQTNDPSQPSNGFIEYGEFQAYDEYGNILQVRNSRKGTTVSYVWGYGGKYPIAKIENATYAEVEELLGDAVEWFYLGYIPGEDHESGRDYELTDSDYRSYLDPLLTGFTNALVSLYTYDPLVGITSKTGPNGLIHYFEYDEFGRLYRVIDEDGYLIDEYEYHY